MLLQQTLKHIQGSIHSMRTCSNHNREKSVLTLTFGRSGACQMLLRTSLLVLTLTAQTGLRLPLHHPCLPNTPFLTCDLYCHNNLRCFKRSIFRCVVSLNLYLCVATRANLVITLT